MKKINFYFQCKNILKFRRSLYRNAIITIIKYEKAIYENIDIIFCDDEFMYELNKKYLNHDYYTDVLTFDYSKNNIISAEIYISLQRVKENSEKFNITFDNELSRIIFHGILHLLGYNDSNNEEKKEMTLKENYYLSLINLNDQDV